MSDFTDHVRELTHFLMGLAAVFILTFALGMADLWFATGVAIAITIVTILILAMYGGSRGPTL